MSDTTFPTGGGWQFRQPQTGWVNPANMIGKAASVLAIRKHRLANPAITAKHNLSTDPAEIERELIAFQRARGALPPEQVPSSFFAAARSNLPARVSAAAAGIKRAAQGTAVVLDWLTSGGAPVVQELANIRASICVGCPKNVEGSWYTTAPAELIKSTLEARKDLKLETPSDAALKSCDVCKCLLRLKVWCPIGHIIKGTNARDHGRIPPSLLDRQEGQSLRGDLKICVAYTVVAKTKPRIMAEFPPNCWITRKVRRPHSHEFSAWG